MALKSPARADIAFASGAVAKSPALPQLLEFLCGIAIAGGDVFAGSQFSGQRLLNNLYCVNNFYCVLWLPYESQAASYIR